MRRSPRLSSRRQQVTSGLGAIDSHQLHSASVSTAGSRSATPSTILDESGQAVPPSFMEDPMPSVSPISARLTVREVQERSNVPKRLYGKVSYFFMHNWNYA